MRDQLNILINLAASDNSVAEKEAKTIRVIGKANGISSEEIDQMPVTLDTTQRKIVSSAITDVCKHRSYLLRALNVRSNHVHSVVSRAIKPEKIVNDFKAYGTRALRREWQFSSQQRIWARGASTRYLWKPKHVEAAVDYVLYCQSDLPFELED